MTPDTLTVSFREARPGDEPIVARHVRGIAEAEGLVHKVTANHADYAELLFQGDRPLRGVLAEIDGEVAGCVLWHTIVSTYAGRVGVYIEDVFVEAAFRGRGLGRLLFAEMARRALAAGHDRLQWSVKNDNLAAVAFYERLGTETVDGFAVHRLQGEGLAALAAAPQRRP